MITHAGHGSVVRALAHGVPLVCVPMGRDQNDMAARVVYHGLGERLRLKEMSAFELGRLIDRVLSDPSYSARARLMSEKLRDLEHQSPGVAVIEDILSGKKLQPQKGTKSTK